MADEKTPGKAAEKDVPTVAGANPPVVKPSEQRQPGPPKAARAKRVDIIKKLEGIRNSRVLTYICSDRQGAAANIGDDAVRPMYDLVRKIGKTKKIDLFLYSRGGAVEVPWRIISMFREHCKELCALIPYRAHSAATLIALGCDRLVMGPKAELGPIDPALSRMTPQEGGTPVQEEIRVEDVMSYIGFLRDKAGLGDQAALADNVRILADKLSPWVLGNIYRTHSHIRMVARKMLGSHGSRMEDQRANLIVDALAEKTYLHGHAIGRTEGEELGLPVDTPQQEVEDLMWSLFELYEEALEMRRPLDPESLLGNNDEYSSRTMIAMLESQDLTWAYRGELKVRRIRQTPGQISINLNLNVGLPAGLDPANVPQEIVNNLMKQIQNDVPRIVNEQARRQSPVLRIEGAMRSGYWQDVTPEGV